METSSLTLSTSTWTEVTSTSDYVLITVNKGVAYFCYSPNTPTESNGAHTINCSALIPKGSETLWLMAGAKDTKIAYTGFNSGLLSNGIL